jgi:hypothetical protein
LSLLSTLILNLADGGDYADTHEGSYEVVYGEPDVSGGVEGVDYNIVYGVDEAETKQ